MATVPDACVIAVCGVHVTFSSIGCWTMTALVINCVISSAIFVRLDSHLVAVLGSALGVVAVSIRALESEETKAKRLELKRQKELRAVTQRISAYARMVHKRFPTGDVVVSECDLAEQLRKRTDVVVTALNLLLNEQKVQRAPLSGYWKLNV